MVKRLHAEPKELDLGARMDFACARITDCPVVMVMGGKRTVQESR